MAAPFLKSVAHIAEHPNTIRFVQNRVILPLGGATLLGLGVGDTLRAKPEARRQVAIRDALVLGATAVGTFYAARGLGWRWLERQTWMKFQGWRINQTLKDGMMPLEYPEKLHELKEAVAEGAQKLKAWRYPQKLVHAFEAFAEDKTGLGDIKKQQKGLQSVLQGMRDHLKAQHPEEQAKQLWKTHTAELFPEKAESFAEEAQTAMGFFGTGLVSVLSGLAGGLAANKINGVQDPNATTNMIKEGAFQFIANIALCAVGAMAALALVNGEFVPIQPLQKYGWAKWLNGQGEAFTKIIAGTGHKKLIRTGIIGAGLSVGIFGGSHLANVLGRKVINPLCDQLQGKPPQALNAYNQSAPPKEKRKIEVWDWILHLDDLPTAMALAGFEFVKPFIPLFFAFSGYRTGIGYRNDEKARQQAAPSFNRVGPPAGSLYYPSTPFRPDLNGRPAFTAMPPQPFYAPPPRAR